MLEEKTLDNPFAIMTPEFQKKIKTFRKEWAKRYKAISNEPTPQYDGNGKPIIKKRPDGKDYIEDFWMSAMLNRNFPGWSWEKAGGLNFLGSEWVSADGVLVIIDESLLAFGINPPVRRYWAGDAVRIQYKRDKPHTPENIVDIGDSVQSAITGAKKRAINRLCGIGDDIYGKRAEENGAGDTGDILSRSDEIKADHTDDLVLKAFNQYIEKKHKTYSQVFMLLGIKGLSEITDYKEAYDKLVEVWGK